MIGETLGSYKVMSRIGAGGMGEVFLAEHALIGRRAAIKVLLPELSKNQEIVQRFFNEARSTAMIRHPGLVDVFDFGYHAGSGSAYLAMELLEGESLGARLRRDHALAPGFAVTVARQVAGALAAAHDKGIVHRDLKPDNLFLVPDKDVVGGTRVKVLDFGIAKLAGEPGGEGSVRTRTGAVMGTPVYMSPEQCKGAGTVDLRSDVYALGCIIHECLTGRPPFTGEGFGEILGKHMYEAPAPLRSLAPHLPVELETLVARTLAKAPGERPANMVELDAALAAVAPLLQTMPPMVRATVAPTARDAGPVVSPVAPTVAPKQRRQESTTMSSSAAQQLARAETPPVTGAGKYSRRRGLFAGLGGLAVAGVAVIAITTGGGTPGPGGGGGGLDVQTSAPVGGNLRENGGGTLESPTRPTQPTLAFAGSDGDAGAPGDAPEDAIDAARPRADAGTARASTPPKPSPADKPRRPPPTTGPLELPFDPTDPNDPLHKTRPVPKPGPEPEPGGVAKGAFFKVVNQARPRVVPCLGGKAGTIMVKAHVGASGTVKDMALTSDEFDDRALDCAEVVLRSLDFPATPEGWRFRVPVKFAAEPGAGDGP